KHLAEILMSADIAADAIAGKQDRTAKESVARPFKKNIRGQLLDCEAMLREPGVEERRLAGTDAVAEARAEKPLLIHQARVGREHQVRQTRLRRHQLDLYAQADQRLVKMPPLLQGPLRRAAARPAHPRVDLV